MAVPVCVMRQTPLSRPGGGIPATAWTAAPPGENVTEAYLADPMKRALIQIQAVFAELEKSMIVKKLRAARQALRCHLAASRP